MQKYKRKIDHITVVAVQFDGTNAGEFLLLRYKNLDKIVYTIEYGMVLKYKSVDETERAVYKGDWIVKSQNSFWNCSDVEFKTTFFKN